MYAVIGAAGYLGSYVIKTILERTDEAIVATARSCEGHSSHQRLKWRACDVQSEESVLALLPELKQCSNVKIIYLAAYHHPDLVEKNRRLAWDINVTSLSRFINAADFADQIFYASTDSVYGNSINSYHFKEDDPCHPVNFYGHNKCAAEAIMVHSGRQVVRFPFLISPSLVPKKHFYDQIVDQLKQGRPVEMFADSFRSSLGFDRAAELWIDLIEKGAPDPIVNICGDKDLSKYDVGRLIATREHMNAELIIPVSAKNSKEWSQTKRAESTLMDNSLLKHVLGLKAVDIFEKPERLLV